jgi:hypothetical protein
MSGKIERRSFIALLGGAAAALPLAARAQQGAKLLTVGFLGEWRIARRMSVAMPSTPLEGGV